MEINGQLTQLAGCPVNALASASLSQYPWQQRWCWLKGEENALIRC